MKRNKLNTNPRVFRDAFLEKTCKYTMRSQGSYIEPHRKTDIGQFAISFRGPHLWNHFLRKERRIFESENIGIFRNALKNYFLFNYEDEISFF